MKKVAEELRYDGATLEQVYEMLADPAFREAVCESQGVLRHTVQIKRDGEGMSVQIDQVQPAEGVPGFATKFAGETTSIVQTEEWTLPSRATIPIETPGKPTAINGTALLTEAGGRPPRRVDARGEGQGPADRRQARGPDGRPGPRPSGEDKEA